MVVQLQNSIAAERGPSAAAERHRDHDRWPDHRSDAAARRAVRPSRMGGRVVLDIVDDSGASATPRAKQAAAGAAPASTALDGIVTGTWRPIDNRFRRRHCHRRLPLPTPAAPLAAAPARGTRSTGARRRAAARRPRQRSRPRRLVREQMTEQTPPGRDVLPENEGPVGLRARRTRLPKEMDGTAFLVPFDSTTGAAAFQSGDSTYVVFDERRPVDMAALRPIRCLARRPCSCCRPARCCGFPTRRRDRSP